MVVCHLKNKAKQKEKTEQNENTLWHLLYYLKDWSASLKNGTDDSFPWYWPTGRSRSWPTLPTTQKWVTVALLHCNTIQWQPEPLHHPPFYMLSKTKIYINEKYPESIVAKHLACSMQEYEMRKCWESAKVDCFWQRRTIYWSELCVNMITFSK